MNSLTGAYQGPSEAITLVSTADFLPGKRSPANYVERRERRWTTRYARCEETNQA